jgi:hypothetical protein
VAGQGGGKALLDIAEYAEAKKLRDGIAECQVLLIEDPPFMANVFKRTALMVATPSLPSA